MHASRYLANSINAILSLLWASGDGFAAHSLTDSGNAKSADRIELNTWDPRHLAMPKFLNVIGTR